VCTGVVFVGIRYVVSFYDAFINPAEGNVTIIVEYMDGGSLQDIVDTGGCGSESVLANISWRLLQVRNSARCGIISVGV